jgi:hypothetical protein
VRRLAEIVDKLVHAGRYREPVSETKAVRSVIRLLVFVGPVLLRLCVATVVRRQDALAGGFAVLGFGSMVLAALAPRLTGPVEMGLSGFKMELVKLSETGRILNYSNEDILVAIENKLSSRDPARPPSEPPAQPPTLEIVNGDDDGDLDRATDLANLAGTLRAKFYTGGELDDLDETIKSAQAAVALTPPKPPHRPAMLGILGELLLGRVQRTGQRPEDLNFSVSLLREAMMSTPRNSPTYAQALGQLADALRFRYYFFGGTG